ncbi:MAG: NADH:ubiquinone reductase (Na(+)-transporting) subunit B [Candidatus Omnitrophica bacterium]|nr:NADH:ubiquinone reductase (Na(+)-transporting) subunit B [Candidatus Omnitrophota bacterium]MCB9747131.1 NADH:ubiquinone reductase (Na(+)-transporting) subunit B [Candidatus Omnitrophota bacterium]
MSFLKEKSKEIEEKFFSKGKPLEKLYPLFDALDTFLLTPGKITRKAPHVRDSVDIKRVMIFVVVALLPCIMLGIYNVGFQILKAQGSVGSLPEIMLKGSVKVLPIIIVTYMVGGLWEGIFAIIRKHEINEGFLVTGILFALTLPPSIPLWQVAVGISFGVVFGKEIFGGTGYNFLNPALTARAFIFFAYPAQMSGDAVWAAVDGFSQATPLAVVAASPKGASAVAALADAGYSLKQVFLGFIPGSIGETSTAACLAGLIFLLITRVASWRIIAGCVVGMFSMSSLFLLFKGPESLAFFSLPPYWHMVMGGFAFGAIFMATDPVSSSATNVGRWIYGFLIGGLVVLIRMVNPAYPEGVMLAILFMNIFAPTIDHFVVQANVNKRLKRVKAVKES